MTVSEMPFRFLYSTAEEFPNHRVDLTELFSLGIAARGHAIDWHMRTVAPSRGRVEELNGSERLITTRKLPVGSIAMRIGNALLAILHEMKLLWLPSRCCYSFIQVRDKTFGGLLGLIGARVAGKPYYYWMSFPFAEASLFRARDRSLGLTRRKRFLLLVKGYISSLILYRVILPRADHIFVQSDRMKDDVASQGIPADRMTPVPMCVTWDRIVGTPISPATDDCLQRGPAIVYVGTLVRARRMDFLIEVFAVVLRKCPDAVLVIIGDGPPSDIVVLKAAVDRLGVKEAVRFLGFLPMEEAWRYVKAAQVCVSPIRPSPMLDPGSPTKVIEYLALGKPVVANEQPDQANVIHESGAGIVVPFEISNFAEAVLELLQHPAKAEEMGLNGPEYVRLNRSYESLVPKLEAKYIALLNGVQTGVPIDRATGA